MSVNYSFQHFDNNQTRNVWKTKMPPQCKIQNVCIYMYAVRHQIGNLKN